MAKEKSSQKIVNIWTKIASPLRSLNNLQIEQMLQQARQGNDERLQVAYFEIEKSNPIFSICINKRISGVQNRAWDIQPIDDSDIAKRQADEVRKMFRKCDMKNKDGLSDAVSHLVLATFRGRSAVKPFITDDGELILKKLHNWNFISFNGKNYWNPNADYTYFGADEIPNGITEIPEDEVAYVVDDKPLDWIGISIYLRQLVGEEAFARFIDTYGLPPVIITAPEGIPESEFEKFNFRAQALFSGGSGVLPNGSDVKYINDARGQDPFSSYIDHQTEMFCILATGSTLATIGGSSGLGSNTAEIQNTQLQSMINYDCKRISNAITASVVSKCVKNLFGDKAEVLCRFSFIEDDNTSIEQYLNYAKMCKDMGMTVDVQKLKELTKLSFINELEKDVWSPQSESGVQE